MKNFKLILLTLAIPLLMVSCKKESGCESGSLYWVPACASIKGYIIFDNGITRVFRHTVAAQFQGSGIRVCVTYTVDANQVLTADCTGGQVVTLTSIEGD